MVLVGSQIKIMAHKAFICASFVSKPLPQNVPSDMIA